MRFAIFGNSNGRSGDIAGPLVATGCLVYTCRIMLRDMLFPPTHCARWYWMFGASLIWRMRLMSIPNCIAVRDCSLPASPYSVREMVYRIAHLVV